MSVNIISGPQLENNITSSAKRPLDNKDFVEALNSNLNNTKSTAPIKEKPQQTTKQPTQQRNESYANSDKKETISNDDSNQISEIVEQPAPTPDSKDEDLMLSGSLIMDSNAVILNTATADVEATIISPEVDVVVIDEQARKDNTILRDATAHHATSTLLNPELLVSQSDSSDEAEVAIPETEIFIPEALVSSEVPQLQQITSLPAQELGEEITTPTVSAIPVETKQTSNIVTESDDMSGTQLQQNTNDTSASTMNKQAMEKQAVERQGAQTNPEAQIIEQAAVGSPLASNADGKRTESRVSDPRTNPNISSIVESVTVEPIQNLGDMNSEMSFGSGDKKMDFELPTTSQDLGEIPHFDGSAKPLTSQAVDTNLQTETSEDMHSISNQLKSAVQKIDAVNGKRITITLTPESLGRVEVELTTNKAGHITAIEIKAVKPETLSMLEKNSQLLQDALKEVTPGNDASLSFNLKEGSHEGNQQQENTKQANNNVPMFDINNTILDDETSAPRSMIQGNIDTPSSSTVKVNMKL